MIDYLERFDESFARCVARNRGADFFESFYTRFMAADPIIAEKFASTDFVRQREMLSESLTEMRSFFTEHTRTPYLAVLGKVHGHNGRKIEAHLYDVWLVTLVQTVKEFDSEYDDQTGIAWRIVLAPGIEFMRSHYDR